MGCPKGTRLAPLDVGGAAAEAITQLLDHDRQTGRIASHDGRLGLVGRWPFAVQHGSKSRKARNLEQNRNCVICSEAAHEAVIVEGVAEVADVAARRKMIPVYEKKYKWDLSTMKDDLLSMKEPVFAVRPRVVFGLWEKEFMGKSTRWRFE